MVLAEDGPAEPGEGIGMTQTTIDLSVSQTLSLEEAAVALGISRSTAYAVARRGEFPIPVLSIGRKLRRVSRLQLERYLAGEPMSSSEASA